MNKLMGSTRVRVTTGMSDPISLTHVRQAKDGSAASIGPYPGRAPRRAFGRKTLEPRQTGASAGARSGRRLPYSTAICPVPAQPLGRAVRAGRQRPQEIRQCAEAASSGPGVLRGFGQHAAVSRSNVSGPCARRRLSGPWKWPCRHKSCCGCPSPGLAALTRLAPETQVRLAVLQPTGTFKAFELSLRRMPVSVAHSALRRLRPSSACCARE